jgi:hypothetical protein
MQQLPPVSVLREQLFSLDTDHLDGVLGIITAHLRSTHEADCTIRMGRDRNSSHIQSASKARVYQDVAASTASMLSMSLESESASESSATHSMVLELLLQAFVATMFRSHGHTSRDYY